MLKKLVAFAALWWLLAGYDRESWWIGLPALAGALALARRPPSPARVGLAGSARFAAFFLHGSIRGGIDVAARVLRPSLPIAPEFVRYPLRQGEMESSKHLFLGAVSLLPGTLAVGIEDNAVTLHALDRKLATSEAMALLEARASGVFVQGAARS